MALVSKLWKSSRRKKHASRKRTRALNGVEKLENRVLLAGDVSWAGPIGGTEVWNEGSSWVGGDVPDATETALFSRRNGTAQLDADGPANTTAGALRIDTSNNKIDLNTKSLTFATGDGIRILGQGVGGMGVAPIQAVLDIDNTGDGSNTVFTTKIDVGVSGETQAVGPQNQARLTITDRDVTVSASDDITVGGQTVGNVVLERAQLAGDDLKIGGTGDQGRFVVERTSVIVGTDGTLIVDNITVGSLNGADKDKSLANNAAGLSELVVKDGGTVTVGNLDNVQLGQAHRGHLTVTNGGVLDAGSADITVGNSIDLATGGILNHNDRGTGKIVVDGNGSRADARNLGVGVDVTISESRANGVVDISNGGRINVDQDVEIGFLNGHAGALATGVITVGGTDAGTRALLDVDGAMTIGQTGTLTINDGGDVIVDGLFKVEEKAGGAQGTVNINAGGRFAALGGVDNDGVFKVSQNGKVNTFDKPFRNERTVVIGDSPGEFELDGDFIQESDGTLFVELGGIVAVDQFDVLKVDDVDGDTFGGNAMLGGRLDVSFIDGFESSVQAGDTFSVLTATAGLSGEFETVDFGDAVLADGFAWQVVYDRTTADGDGLEVVLEVLPPVEVEVDAVAIEAALSSYSPGTDFDFTDQDTNSIAAVVDNGATLQIDGDGWKKIALPYNVTASTVLEFDFASTSEGEIHGIGFDNDDVQSEELTFRLFGTQAWGIHAFNNYVGGGAAQHYVIPVGQFYTGDMEFLTFINDHDVSDPTASSVFSNIQIYDDPSLAPLLSVNEDAGQAVEVYGGALQNSPGELDVETRDDDLNTTQETLSLTGNGWRKVDFDYVVTADTVLEFDFSSTSEGEIHAIGFDNNNSVSTTTTRRAKHSLFSCSARKIGASVHLMITRSLKV